MNPVLLAQLMAEDRIPPQWEVFLESRPDLFLEMQQVHPLDWSPELVPLREDLLRTLPEELADLLVFDDDED